MNRSETYHRGLEKELDQQQEGLPPRSRPEDPDTSKKAEPTPEEMTKSQIQVLKLFISYGDMTHYELQNKAREHKVAQAPSGLRTRCSELVDFGFIEDTGEVRENYLGNDCTVWDLAVDIDMEDLETDG